MRKIGYNVWWWSLDGGTCFSLSKVERFIIEYQAKTEVWDVFAKLDDAVKILVYSAMSKETAQRWLGEKIKGE